MRCCGTLLLALVFCHAARGSAQAVHDINVGYIDTTCAPCQDFYAFANGGWINRTSLPDKGSAMGALDELNTRRATTLSRILDSLRSQRTPQASPEEKVAEFYASCMDVSSIQAQGASPMLSELRRIRAIKSVSHVEHEVARLHRMQIPLLFVLQALPDAKDSKHIIADLSPAGLGLGEKDAYFRSDSESVAGQHSYVKEITRMLELAGEPVERAQKEAEGVLLLEKRLAAATLGMEMSRDPAAVYHKTSVTALQSAAPKGWSWKQYFRDVGRADIVTANVQEPAYFEALDKALLEVPLSDFKAYLTIRYVRSATRRLGGPAVDSLLGEFGRGNLAKQSVTDRKRYCADETEYHLGWIVGRIYASTEFTAATRAKADAMVRNIRAVLSDELDKVSWMGAQAKREALRKLDSFVVELGYPNQWPDYSGVQVRRGQFWENVVAANEYQTGLELARIGRAQSLDDWWAGYWPQTADAYFNENLNEIVMAAGYMQPPFFDPAADDAFNYGAFGAVIGHEMTHAFDDRGRKFDSNANLRDWWTSGDEAAFAQRASRAVAQYDRYIVVDTLHINGRQTLSENLADIGGLKLAYAALERSLTGEKRVTVDGLSPEQRFFIAYAQSRRGLFGPDYLRDKVLMNTHSPEKWRVIGAIANMPEFALAFGCKSGDAMTLNEADRVHLW